MPMSWNGLYKSISSISVSGSPELSWPWPPSVSWPDLKPSALCIVSGSDGIAYAYQTYTLDYNGNTYVGSAYPTY